MKPFRRTGGEPKACVQMQRLRGGSALSIHPLPVVQSQPAPEPPGLPHVAAPSWFWRLGESRGGIMAPVQASGRRRKRQRRCKDREPEEEQVRRGSDNPPPSRCRSFRTVARLPFFRPQLPLPSLAPLRYSMACKPLGAETWLSILMRNSLPGPLALLRAV